jgi:hypothetical protein
LTLPERHFEMASYSCLAPLGTPFQAGFFVAPGDPA